MSDTQSGQGAANAESAAQSPMMPPDMDPEVFAAKVHAALHEGAYVSAISVAAAPGCAAEARSHVWAHRLRVQDFPPEHRRGLCATNTAGKLHFDLSQRLGVLPDGATLPSGDDVTPVPLDPRKSQTIALTDAELTFDAQGKNRLLGSAIGRTYPETVAGKSVVRFGANGEIIRGFGIFDGVVGSYVINGVLGSTGPEFHILIRFQDSGKKFETSSDLCGLEPIRDPQPGSTFMTILGREDPEHPVQQKFENGKLVGGHVTELFSTAWLDFDDGRRGNGLRTTRKTGQLIGKLETDINFAPSMPPSPEPTPFSTANTTITFWDSNGKVVGTLHPNIEVGQAMMMPLPGFAMPVPSFRIVGFGPIRGGTGWFEGAQGMLSVNSIIAVEPAALYNMYVFCFDDPEHRFRPGGREPAPAPTDSEVAKEELKKWQDILNRGACFNMFALPDPAHPCKPISMPHDPTTLAGVDVRGVGHRFQIKMVEPTPTNGLKAKNVVGEKAVGFGFRWLVIPHDFGAAPGRQPPPTALDMQTPQRFALMDAVFDFGNGNRIFTIGAGQTFPLPGPANKAIRIAALGAVLEGFGKFKGLPGNYFLSGYFAPPSDFRLNIFVRIQDVNGELLIDSLPPIKPVTIPNLDTTYLMIRVENPPMMTKLSFSAEGIPESMLTMQDLTQLECDFAIIDGTPKAYRKIGRRYGHHRVALSGAVLPTPTNPGTVASPLPFTDQEEFFLYDTNGDAMGWFEADVIEGRMIMTPIEGIPAKVGSQIVGGFAPIGDGTGAFKDLTGIALNVGVGLVKPDLMDLPYIMAIRDPSGKYRA